MATVEAHQNVIEGVNRYVHLDAETARTATLWGLVDIATTKIPELFPEIDAAAMRLCMSLSCGADLVAYDIAATIREQRASVPMINPLLILSLFGELEMRDLTRLCNKSRAAMSMVVDELFKDGLATRRSAEDDRRVVIVGITDLGLAELRRIFGLYNERESHWAKGLTSAEQRQFIALLGKMVSARTAKSDIKLRK